MKPYIKASYVSEPNQRELDNLQVAYEAACECMVLLKNEGCLPFSSNQIALYGAGATKTIKGGTGSGEVNERHSVSIAEGMRDRGIQLMTEDWLAAYEDCYAQAQKQELEDRKKRISLLHPSTFMELISCNFRAPAGPVITEADVEKSATDNCVYVVSRQAGEGGDRKAEKGDLFLTDEELEAIRFCADHYKHFLLVINAGSSIDMGFLQDIDGIDAVLYICQLGSGGGHALADVITGKVNP